MKSKESRSNDFTPRHDAPFFKGPQVQAQHDPEQESFFSPATIQPKLTIGAPDDHFEREADSMADQVVNTSNSPTPGVQAKCAACEGEEKTALPKLQRMEMGDEDELMTKPDIQRVEDGMEEDELAMKSQPGVMRKEDGLLQASSELEGQLNSSKGGGQSLPANIQREMGQSFGADFSGVRVHTDSRASEMNRDIQAQAFTHGSDIYFNSGKYNPESSSGKHLLAHELTHTIQQGAVE